MNELFSSTSFITYRSCKHLDGKHTIFGHVVGGMETLNAMERIATDNKDRPVEDILIESAAIFTDPYVEVDELVRNKLGRSFDQGLNLDGIGICLAGS